MPHKQTKGRRLSNQQLEQLLRQRVANGLPVRTKAIRHLGVAFGRCRASRLRRRVLAAVPPSPAPPPRPSPPPAESRGTRPLFHSATMLLRAFLRRGVVPRTTVPRSSGWDHVQAYSTPRLVSPVCATGNHYQESI